MSTKVFQDPLFGALWVMRALAGLSQVDLLSSGFKRFVNFKMMPSGDSDNRVRALPPRALITQWLRLMRWLLRLLPKTYDKLMSWRERPGNSKALDGKPNPAFTNDRERCFGLERVRLACFDPAKTNSKPCSSALVQLTITISNESSSIATIRCGFQVMGFHRRRANETTFKPFRHNLNDDKA